ncbi:MAG: AAA family ATPase [Anaerolineae bacterium]
MTSAIALNQRSFLVGPAGSGKTTLAVQHLDALLHADLQNGSILVLAPQRSLLRPYQAHLHQAELPGREEVELLTVGGLARRSVDLMWPAIAANSGFAQPNESPTFLTLETAQYYMELVVRPFTSERFYFENVRVPPQRLYSQLLDNLNKAALVGFPHTDVGRRLIEAWDGPAAQTITYAQVQDCLNRFRDYCLAHNLLDFSLQIELFHSLLQRDWFKSWLYRRYRHLIVDNVEEESPFAHELLRDWLPHADSALIVYDTNAGYRSFLGADARSGYALRSACDQTIELTDSHVMSIEMRRFEVDVVRVLDRYSELPMRIDLTTNRQPAIEFGGGRFYPQMLDWVADRIGDLVRDSVAPRDIAVLTPFLGDALRFALEERLQARHIPTRSLRPSRALNEEVVTRGLMTLANLAYADRAAVPPQADVAQALTLSIAGLDPARGHLLAERLYRVRDGQAELNPFDVLKPELQDRIGYEVGARYDRLRTWLSEHRTESAVPLDHFLAKLFGEVLSQPGFGFHAQIDPGRITAQIIESARKFRQTIGADANVTLTETVARDYIQMVSEGVVAATFVVSPYAETPDAVLLAPAYTFLLSNESVGYQFWLNAGSPAWWERLYQPLTHPYVLTRDWPAGKKWTDQDEQTKRREVLLRLMRGLIRRCRTRVYLAISTLNEQGFEERGPLLTMIQQVLRDSANT